MKYLLIPLLVCLGCLAAQAEVIKDLPDDATWPHVSLIVHDNWQQIPAERELVAAWSAVKEPGTHFHLYTVSNPIFRTKLAHRVKQIPCTIAQTADGVIHDVSVDIAVGAGIKQFFGNRPWSRLCPWRRPSPTPDTCPVPTDRPPQEDTDMVIVPEQTAETPKQEEYPLAWAVGLALLTAIGYYRLEGTL